MSYKQPRNGGGGGLQSSTSSSTSSSTNRNKRNKNQTRTRINPTPTTTTTTTPNVNETIKNGNNEATREEELLLASASNVTHEKEEEPNTKKPRPDSLISSISSSCEDEEEEELEEEPPSVVNASLIVNLSNANVSQVSFLEGDAQQQLRRDGLDLVDELLLSQQDGEGGGGGDGNDSSCTVVAAASPMDDVEVVEFGGGGKEISSSSSNSSAAAAVHSNNEDQVINQDKVEEAVVEEQKQQQQLLSSTSSAVGGGGEPASTKQQPNNNMQLQSQSQQSGISVDNNSSESESNNLADSEVENLMMMMRSPEEIVLPKTVTVLKAPNGVDVYLVGTAHFSHQSQLDVVQTIQQTNPTLVLLELCSSRRNILSLDEETVLKEVSEMNFQKVRLALSNSGAVQGVLHLLLLSMSAQLTRKLGMAPGGEFRAATREARKIPGCVLLLGDRPFNITITRALAALSFFQKIKLAWQFVTSNEDITKEEIEKCKELDAISMLLKEMTGEFPSITEVFVNERDVFLAHSLLLAATSEAHGAAGKRNRVVVGVVGMGHVPGIVKNWAQTTDESVNELLRIPETPISTIIIRKTFKVCWYGLLGYGLYRIGKRVGSSAAGTRSIENIGKIVGERVSAVTQVLYKKL